MTDADRNGWDAIVIGSGIGGMAAAAALSKNEYRVLLLEQYQTLGGLSHSFTIEGFQWDAGIHYLNHVAPEDRLARQARILPTHPHVGTISQTRRGEK